MPGNGTKRGSCSAGLKCHVNGACSVCSRDANTDLPHSGCDVLSPQCNDKGTECKCDTAEGSGNAKCEAVTSSVCDTSGLPNTAPECKCGSDPACETTTPVCDTSSDTATCATCNVDGSSGDGTAQGTCPDGLNCHSDGSCSFCAQIGSGDKDTPHSGCNALNPKCADDLSMCECATDYVCNSATATVCDTTCKCGAAECTDGTPICDQSDAENPACAACSVEGGGSADGSEKGNCPGETDKCHSTGFCAVCIEDVGDGNAATPHSGCTTIMPKCDTGICGPE